MKQRLSSRRCKEFAGEVLARFLSPSAGEVDADVVHPAHIKWSAAGARFLSLPRQAIDRPESRPYRKAGPTLAFVRRFYLFWPLIHSVETDFGRVIAVPIARLSTNCDSMPIARETENSTV
jgi:hypothetical protein